MGIEGVIHPTAPSGSLEHLHAEIDQARGTPEATRPAVFVDGAAVPAGARASGRAAVIYTTNDKTLAEALSRVDVACLHLYECRAADLTPLAAQLRLTGLSIDWANKVADLEFLTDLTRLEALSLVDLSKVRDLSPLVALRGLKGLIIAGSMAKGMRVNSLGPVGQLSGLREVSLMATRVDDPLGPRPLTGCIGVYDLWLPNTFETVDYAYLAAHMPHTACARFRGFERLEQPLNGMNLMVTGKRKPLLSLPQDDAKAHRFEAAFQSLKAAFAAEAP